MRLMNNRLLDESYKVTDADITSVALLVILEVILTFQCRKQQLMPESQTINGSFEAATAHKIGLSKMVNFYGGIWNLEYNPVVIRVLSWQVQTINTQMKVLTSYKGLILPTQPDLVPRQNTPA
jgi:hypothetical protein